MKRKISQLSTLMLVPYFALGSPMAKIANTIDLAEPISVTETAEVKDYWTYDELTEFNQIVSAELDSACGEVDPECRSEFFMTHTNSDSIYRALERFYYDRLLITAFNPSENTMRIVYRDVSLDTWRTSAEPERLTDIFIVRYDVGHISSYLPDAVLAGTDPGIHVVYYDQSLDQPEEIWFPANVEHTIQVPPLEMSPTIQNSFNYHINISTMSYNHSYGSASNFNYGECLQASSGYEKGMECRLVYTPSGNVTYRPFEPKTESDESDESNSGTTTSPTDPDQETPEDPSATPTDPDGSGSNNPAGPTESTEPTEPTEPESPKAPGRPENPPFPVNPSLPGSFRPNPNPIRRPSTASGSSSNSPDSDTLTPAMPSKPAESKPGDTSDSSFGPVESDISSMAPSGSTLASGDSSTTSASSSSSSPFIASATPAPQASQTARQDAIVDSSSGASESGKSEIFGAVTDVVTDYNSPDLPLSGDGELSAKFQWWLLVVIILGLGALAWWLIAPLYENKKHQK